MKRCKVIALIICSVVVVICTAMIIRINIQFPKAEDKSYTIDNPADIDGVIVKPLSYQVCTIDEYSQISSEYSKVKDEKKDNIKGWHEKKKKKASRELIIDRMNKNDTDGKIQYGWIEYNFKMSITVTP